MLEHNPDLRIIPPANYRNKIKEIPRARGRGPGAHGADFGPSWGQLWANVGPMLSRFGGDTVQIWDQFPVNLVPIWKQFGTKLGPIRGQIGDNA